MPATRGLFVFVGPHVMLSRRMLGQVKAAGGRAIVCRGPTGFQKIPLYRFTLWRLGDATIRRLGRISADHPLLRLVETARRVPFLRGLWRLLLRRRPPLPAAGSNGSDEAIALYRDLFARAKAGAHDLPPPVRDRVVLVNAGLAAGGAERQLLNTMAGLKRRGLEDVTLLGEHLSAPGLDFYLPNARAAGLRVLPLERRIELAEHGLASVPLDVAERISLLPPDLIEGILNLVEAFRALRPAVVHAWQDATSIRCGIAGAIAGVPRLVLSSRNVNPMNFVYGEPYMEPAYLALAELAEVVLVNNSEAGAADYCRWLGLPRERYKVLRNGVDLSGLSRSAAEDSRRYRRETGIPDGVPVVGSVFRFWEEKRPLLWIEVAARVAEAMPTVHFLLIGDGPLRGRMEALAASLGLRGRIHLPGTSSNVALPLSVSDLFLLTSEFEGTPNVVLEAEWLGVPVVATEAGGTREAVEEGVTGWVCESPEATAIAQRVVAALADAAWMATASRRGPRFVEERFGVARMIDETLALYGLSPDAAPAVGPGVTS